MRRWQSSSDGRFRDNHRRSNLLSADPSGRVVPKERWQRRTMRLEGAGAALTVPAGEAAEFLRCARPALTGAYRLAGYLLRDATEAEDAVQDSLEKAWQAWPRLRQPDRFDPWFDRIVVEAGRRYRGPPGGRPAHAPSGRGPLGGNGHVYFGQGLSGVDPQGTIGPPVTPTPDARATPPASEARRSSRPKPQRPDPRADRRLGPSIAPGPPRPLCYHRRLTAMTERSSVAIGDREPARTAQAGAERPAAGSTRT
jgi:hypothetical protein